MLVPGNLKLVIIHRDKPRTGSLERVARSRDALQGRQPVRKRKGEGLVVSRYRTSCMEITGIPAGSLSFSFLHEEVGGIGHNDLRFEIESRLHNPPLLLLPPPFLDLTDLVSSGTSPRIDKPGNRFSSRFASKKKKRKKREYLLLRARWTKSFSSWNENSLFFFSLSVLTSERISRVSISLGR